MIAQWQGWYIVDYAFSKFNWLAQAQEENKHIKSKKKITGYILTLWLQNENPFCTEFSPY